MELKRCTVIDMRWKRKLGSRMSPKIDAILRPSSEKKAIDKNITEELTTIEHQVSKLDTFYVDQLQQIAQSGPVGARLRTRPLARQLRRRSVCYGRVTKARSTQRCT